MYRLGISAFYHDSAAALLKDGVVVAAFEEERFSRKKHDNTFPVQAIHACLEKEGITSEQLESVTYYEKPLLKFERILDSIIASFPRTEKIFQLTVKEWFGQKIRVEKHIQDTLNYTGPVYFIPHHTSHAAATFYTSPFTEAAILTADGVGEYTTTALWSADTRGIECIKELHFPHSLGLLYSTFTAFLGFKVNNDEYKMMGLAAYGSPRYKEKIFQMLDTKPNGSFKLKSDYFTFETSIERLYSKKFTKLIGAPRLPSEPITQFHKDIAASIQEVLEEMYVALLNELHRATKKDAVCISGGVGLNALANGKILNQTPFKKIHIFGPAGDGGSAVGAALYTHIQNNEKKTWQYLKNLSLGSSYTNEVIRSHVEKAPHTHTFCSSKKEQNKEVAKLLHEGKVGALFEGEMEYGPRALGSRSIIASPQSQEMKERVNSIKKREDFRPFGISVLQEHAHALFEIPMGVSDAPYMNMCFVTKKEWRENIPAVVHADNTTRIQTVSPSPYYDVINEFYTLSGVPGILNTSLNIKGEPLIENPEQALHFFETQPVDFLVLGDYILTK